MKIYIDSEFKCYIEAAEGRTEIETSTFDGKCKEYIEGFRFIPSGAAWTRWDNIIFEGEVSFPWKDFQELERAQFLYVQEKLADAEAALKLLGVE